MSLEAERQALIAQWKQSLPPGLYEELMEVQRLAGLASRKTTIIEQWERTPKGKKLTGRRRITTEHGWRAVKEEDLPLA